jgi:tetratricopeptide (TPR) repeat protein
MREIRDGLTHLLRGVHMGKRWRRSEWKPSKVLSRNPVSRGGGSEVKEISLADAGALASGDLQFDSEWRRATIKRICGIDIQTRTTDQWYLLGCALAYEGFILDDEELRNEAIEALEETVQRGEVELATARENRSPVSAGYKELPDALMMLALLYNFCGLPTQGIRYARRAVELRPESAESWRFLANTLMQQKKSAEAIECLRRALECSDAGEPEKVLLEQWEQESSESAGGLHLLFGMPPELQVDRPLEAQRDKAIYLLYCMRHCIRILPQNPEFLFSAAHLAYHLQRLDEAQRYAGQLTGQHSNHADAWLLLGLIAGKLGNESEALHAYSRVLELRPTDEIAGVNRAKIYLDNAQFLEARIQLLELMKINPANPDTLALYANVVAEYDKDYELCVEYHLRARSAGQMKPVAVYCRMMAFFQAGRADLFNREWSTAESLIKNAAATSEIPEYSTSVLLIAQMFLNSGPRNFIDGLVTVEDALKAEDIRQFMTPAIARIWLQKSWSRQDSLKSLTANERNEVYYVFADTATKAGVPDLAIAAWETLIQLKAADFSPVANLALTLRQLNRRDEALRLLERHIDSEPAIREILPSFLAVSGRRQEALEMIRASIPEDCGSKSSLLMGIEFAVLCQDFSLADKWLKQATARFGGSSEIALAAAFRHLRSGYPLRGIEVLEEFLGFRVRDVSVVSQIPESCHPQKSPVVWLAAALIASSIKHSELPEKLFNLLRSIGQLTPDWYVLAAERRRTKESPDVAVEMLAPFPKFPHVVASRAMIAAAMEQFDHAEELAQMLLTRPQEATKYFHPHGSPLALAYLTLSWCAEAAGLHDLAYTRILEAINLDCYCVAAHVQRIELLKLTSPPEDIIDALAEGLCCLPGNAVLISQLISVHLQRNDVDQAEMVLEQHREAMVAQGCMADSSFLSELVLRKKLATLQTQQRAEMPLPWTASLSPLSRDWLRSAQLAFRWRDELALSIVFYLAKVLERELVERIVGPFRQSLDDRLLFDDDRDLREFIQCWQRKHPPGLGAMARALRLAAQPPSRVESELFRSWRRFLKALPEPICSGVRSRRFLDELEAASKLRNMVSHIAGASDSELKRLEAAVLEDDRPGVLLRALGIGV